MTGDIVLTAAPGAVFIRLTEPIVEMKPGEVVGVIRQLLTCLRISLAATDGAGLMPMITERRDG